MAAPLRCLAETLHELHGWGAGPPFYVCPGYPDPDWADADEIRARLTETQFEGKQ